ncbi:FecR family protein [Anaerophaga thermohalophila]|uniref:FecR family protein n=1 Tax=Anaerophaga thermohalophila TaxID=177400 RepID=UPI000237C628|nr:FecR family protein [Anaerophaga thermohalophila]
MEDSVIIPTEMLVRYFSGDISPDEKKRIEAWRRRSKKNERTFHEFKTIWEAEYHSLLPQDAVESDWEKIRDRIRFASPKTRFASVADAFLKIAAIFILMFAVSAALYTYWNVPGFGRWASFQTGDYVDSLQLPDNSVVFLNNYSSLKYLKNFDNGKRSVSLDGEGFFDVESDTKNPFKVKTPEGVIVEVFGTSFHLESGKGIDNLELNVTEGTVSFGYRNHREYVEAGHSATIQDDVVSVMAFSDENFLSWKTGKLEFNQSSLQAIVKALKEHYDEIREVHINTYSDVKVTTSFTNQPISEVLEELEMHFDKKFRLNEGVLTISD